MRLLSFPQRPKLFFNAAIVELLDDHFEDVSVQQLIQNDVRLR